MIRFEIPGEKPRRGAGLRSPHPQRMAGLLRSGRTCWINASRISAADLAEARDTNHFGRRGKPLPGLRVGIVRHGGHAGLKRGCLKTRVVGALGGQRRKALVEDEDLEDRETARRYPVLPQRAQPTALVNAFARPEPDGMP